MRSMHDYLGCPCVANPVSRALHITLHRSEPLPLQHFLALLGMTQARDMKTLSTECICNSVANKATTSSDKNLFHPFFPCLVINDNHLSHG
jgi:hypothetical protein